MHLSPILCQGRYAFYMLTFTVVLTMFTMCVVPRRCTSTPLPPRGQIVDIGSCSKITNLASGKDEGSVLKQYVKYVALVLFVTLV